MIREDQAAQALGLLVGGTQGWNDEAVAIYLSQLVHCNDPDALHRTCVHILKTHADPGRPSIARILERYKYEEGETRRQTPRQQIEAQRQPIPVEQGLKIAWDAYSDECRQQNREPNKAMFNSWARKVTS